MKRITPVLVILALTLSTLPASAAAHPSITPENVTRLALHAETYGSLFNDLKEEKLCESGEHNQLIIRYNLRLEEGQLDNTKVRIELSGVIPNPLYLSNIKGQANINFEPQDLQIHDQNGKALSFTYNKTFKNGPYEGRYQISTPGALKIQIDYGINGSSANRFENDTYFSFFSKSRFLASGGQLFLIPIYKNNYCVEVNFENDAGLSIFTPWQQYSNGFDPSTSGSDTFNSMAESAIAIGEFSRYEEQTSDGSIYFVVDNKINQQVHQSISEGFFKLYDYYRNLFNEPGITPYQGVLSAPADDGKQIYLGEWTNSQGWTVNTEGEENTQSRIGGYWIPWREYGHQLFHAWESGYWGDGFFSPPWVSEGINEFLKYKSTFATDLINEHDTRTMFEMEFINKYEDLLNNGDDYPLERTNQISSLKISDRSKLALTYKKSALFGALLAREIATRTNGEKTINDFIRQIYKKYSGKQKCYESCLLNELNDLTGTDNKDLFNAYIYGKEKIPYDWCFEDDNNDGNLNLFELFLDTYK